MPDPNNHQPPSEGVFILIGLLFSIALCWGVIAYVIPTPVG